MLSIILAPAMLILSHSYGTKNNSEDGWYHDLWREGGVLSKVLFLLMGIVIFPLVAISGLLYNFWEKLLED